METVGVVAEARAWRSVSELWPKSHVRELRGLRLWGELLVECRVDRKGTDLQDVYEMIRTVLDVKTYVPSRLVLVVAIERWGAMLIALRRRQTPEERQKALNEAKNRSSHEMPMPELYQNLRGTEVQS